MEKKEIKETKKAMQVPVPEIVQNKGTIKNTIMRNAVITIPAKIIAKIDRPELNIRAGDIVTYTFEDIKQNLQSWSKKKKLSYYAICHNSDPTNIHFHIVVDFDIQSQGRFRQIRDRFPYGEIKPCKHGVKSCVQYLVHFNDPEKHPYSWDEIYTNATSKLEKYKTRSHNSAEAWYDHYADLIIAGKIKEYEVADKIDEKIYVRFKPRFDTLFGTMKKKYMRDKNCNIEVYVLQGASRAGKGVFVKNWAEKVKKAICFSSTSNDPWQDYMGEEVYCYDDTSFDDMNIKDLTKILDPHNKSTKHSRYHNTVFMGDTIFICTNQSVTSWFPDAHPEDRKALFKRIKLVLDFSEPVNNISTYTYNRLCEKESGWVLEPEGTKTFDLSKYIDVEADERGVQAFIDSLDLL